MAKNLRAKFKEWIVIFVLLPATLFMIVSNFFLWRLLSQSHVRDLEQEMTVVETSLDQVLRSEATRLRTLAKLPASDSLVAMSSRRYSSLQKLTKDKVEEDWDKAGRDDMMVRGVLDNDLGILFRLVTEQEGHVRGLFMIDGFGAPLAASKKFDQYYLNDKDWWILAKSNPGAGVVSESFTPEGLLGITFPMLKKGSRDVVEGMIREEISLGVALDALDKALGRSRRDDLTTLLVADRHMKIAGADNVADVLAGSLAEELNQRGREEGWTSGLRYRARKLDAGVYWARPMWLVVAREEGKFPLRLYGPMASGLIGGIAAVFGVYFFASNVGKKLFFDPMEHAAEAGMWVLKRAFGDQMKNVSFSRTHPWVGVSLGTDEVVTRELEGWFGDVQERIKGNAATISQAMQQDLELAIDFQTAITNRPYPQVPSVHVQGRLRLEFAHQYKPALALGGDFFDIEAIASDCAGIFLADVMGHGTRSAIITSMIRTLLSELYPQGRNAPHFMGELNKTFCGMLQMLPNPFFASASYFLFDTTARIGTYTLAGHPPPYQLHRSVGRVIKLERPTPRGGAIGVMPDEKFGAESVRLVDGDVFIFYTDGVYEAKNRRGEEYGLTRFEASLHAHQYETMDKMLASLIADIMKFVDDEPLADDVCLVGCFVTSQAAPPRA